MWWMTSSTAALLSGSDSLDPSCVAKTRFTPGEDAGLPSSGNSSIDFFVASIDGVPEILNSSVIGRMTAAAMPPTMASRTTHVEMTIHFRWYDHFPKR